MPSPKGKLQRSSGMVHSCSYGFGGFVPLSVDAVFLHEAAMEAYKVGERARNFEQFEQISSIFDLTDPEDNSFTFSDLK